MRNYFQVLALGLLLTAPALANQDGLIVRLSPLHDKASSTSQRVGQLSAGSRVTIFGRKGGWKEVFSEEKSMVGWVRSYQVREGNYAEQAPKETEEDSRGFLAGLASFSRKASRFLTGNNSSTSSGTATIGVRGLSEAEIKSARPDFSELEKMQQYSSNRSRLDRFVFKGQLSANDVPHIGSKKKSSSGGKNLEK